MKVAYLSSAYLAPVEYYSKLLNYDKIFIEQHDHYMKQTYRNRCTIAGPEGELALSIPIVKPEEPKCPMKDIRISDHGNWISFTRVCTSSSDARPLTSGSARTAPEY